MYHPPIHRVERALQLVAIPVVLATLLVIVLYGIRRPTVRADGLVLNNAPIEVYAAEVQGDPPLAVDAPLREQGGHFAQAYTVVDTAPESSQDKADHAMAEWFSGQVPTPGQCYTLRVAQSRPGKTAEGYYQREILMQFVEQPCWLPEASPSTITRGKACVMGWCITKEQP